MIERAVILGDGRRARGRAARSGRVRRRRDARRRRAPSAAAARRARAERAASPALDAAMARHIEAALARTRGRIEGRSGAAALLGINPHTLRARMRKLGIDWRRFRASRA